MSNVDPSFERRLEELAGQVRKLSNRVDELTQEMAALSASEKSTREDLPLSSAFAHQVERGEAASSAPKLGENLSTATVLSSLAAVCFLLVIALVLRLIVKRELIDQRLGAFLGVAYAIVLIAYGYFRYAKSRHIVPVYTISGVVLLLSIVYETHTSFGLLPTPMAFGLLMLALIAMAVMGLAYKVTIPLAVGVLGASVVGLSLDFPELHYPYLAALLFLANGAAYAAIRIARCRWLIWSILGLTLLFWLVWVLKIRAPLLHELEPGSELALPWFWPTMIVFAAVYVAMVLWSILKENWAYPLLERTLPVINVIWAYYAARAVVSAWHGREDQIAVVGAGVAVAHIGLAVMVARRKGKLRRHTAAFIFAAAILLASSLPAAVGNMLVTLLLWSSAAFCLAAIPWFQTDRPTQALAYMFQAFACAVALNLGTFFALTPFRWVVASVALILFMVCLLHYGWRRARAPKQETPFFRIAAVLLLLAAFIYGFEGARMIMFAALDFLQLSSPDDIFQAGQSILINVSALLLLFLGIKWQNGEIFAAGFIAVLVGAAKVFGYDMLHIQDLPLVSSVFIFGITALGSSLMWKRWQLLQPVLAEK